MKTENILTTVFARRTCMRKSCWRVGRADGVTHMQ